MKHIGFIGASGLMGHGIAKNLLAKGFRVSLTAHARQEPLKDLRYYVHLTESVKAPSLVKAQAQINQVKIGKAS
jgi:3-hydroxyisobutyrate dehydrogenase-like beta-hydroxyacid dehydrogenase